MAKHALLSASSSHRWLNCTPSARLEENLPNKESTYAAEGTKAHSLGEIKIKHFLLGSIDKKEYERLRYELDDIPPDMEDATDEYLRFVTEEFEAAKAETGSAVLFLEQKVDYSHIAPDGFGTSDCVIINDTTLHVIDYKHGKGVYVSAVGNPQARLYAAGAAEALRDIYDFTKIRYSIVQPRLDAITSEIIELAELDEWAQNFAAPRAKLAFDGEGEFVTGEHCLFCRAAATCRAKAEEALNIARGDFASMPPLLTDDEIAEEVLPKLDIIEKWCKRVKEYALNMALDGHKWKGYKLVEGGSNRKVTDENALINRLLSSGYDINDVTNLKIKGITELEKTVGKKKFEELAGEYIVKPAGAPTLVPESDKRAEYNSAEHDFKEEF